MYQYIKGAISCSEDTEYTGSFVKLQAVHETYLWDATLANNKQTVATSSLLNITWGQSPQGTPQNINDSLDNIGPGGGGVNGGEIKVNVGDSIEGPIYSFKTKTNGGGWLAYYRKKP